MESRSDSYAAVGLAFAQTLLVISLQIVVITSHPLASIAMDDDTGKTLQEKKELDYSGS